MKLHVNQGGLSYFEVPLYMFLLLIATEFLEQLNTVYRLRHLCTD